jgi:large subunit ribosomal protein L10
MHKSEKERLVEELTERLRSTETLIVADYRGLTVSEIDELRGKLIEQGARFTVVKNTLTKRAAEAAGVEGLITLLDGPTAIAFLETDGDPVAVAKALDDAGKTEVLVVRGGFLEGDEIGADDVKRLAKLPPADVLRAQLVGALAGSLTTVVGLFAAPMRDLVGVIDARIKQLEEQGETAEAPAAEPPVRESGPGEGAPGEPGGSPANEAEAVEATAPEEPAAEEAAIEKPAAEEAAAQAEAPAEPEEPAAEEPAAEEPAAEEPAAEEPAAEEPAAEEPAAEEPEETQEGEEQS